MIFQFVLNSGEIVPFLFSVSGHVPLFSSLRVECVSWFWVGRSDKKTESSPPPKKIKGLQNEEESGTRRLGTPVSLPWSLETTRCGYKISMATMALIVFLQSETAVQRKRRHFKVFSRQNSKEFLEPFWQPWSGVSPTAILNEEKALGTRLRSRKTRSMYMWLLRLKLIFSVKKYR